MVNLFLIVGVICIIISGIIIGAWTGGEQQRANFHSETKDQRDFKTKISMFSCLVGLISIGLAALIYFL